MGIVLLAAHVGAQRALNVIAAYTAPALQFWLVLAAALVFCLLLLAIYVGLVRVMERRGAVELSLRPGARLVIAGLAFGFAMFCAVYAVFWAQGVVRWQGVNGAVDVGRVLALDSIFAGVGEELVFRGVIFRVVEESGGSSVALLVSGVLFGLAHFTKPGATPVSTAAIALEAVLLGASYVLTRNLWFPIGLHIGWNFTEGGVFGAALSGTPAKGLLNAPLHGPDALTGGEFGPEASPATVAVCLIAAVILLTAAIRQGEWKRFVLRLYPR
jgi:membrane protease YdiL (CAAX protease family)